MGRVYNALLKADRLTGGDRRIGRPATENPETRPSAVAPTKAIETKTIATKTTEINRPSQQSRAVSQSIPTYDCNPQPKLENQPASNVRTPAQRNDEPVQSPLAVQPIARPSRLQTTEPSIASPRGSVISDSLPPMPTFAEPREVKSISNLSLAAHLPAITGSDALACERYRTLAVRVSASLTRRRLKTLFVTSAEQGEGKSAVAASLAWMMAKRDNRRVLLIDAGLRFGASSSAFNVASARGWLETTDVLSALTDAIVRLDPNKLYVMNPYGANQKTDFDNAALDEALASSQFEKLIAELSGYFDFIVIDGPAICRSYGAQQLASIAGGTIVVSRAGKTHHSRVTTAVELVPQERRVGIVLNESDAEENAASHDSANGSFIKRIFGFRTARADEAKSRALK